MDDLAELQAIVTDMHAETGTIHWVGADGLLHLAAVVGRFPPPVMDAIRVIPMGKGLAGLAAERRACVTVCNLQHDDSGQARPGARATGMEGAITAPCLAPDGTLAGVVGVANAGERTFTAAEQDALLAHGRRLAAWRASAGAPTIPTDRRIRVLFLCTGNSCRSQMAEGWAKALRGDRVEAFSAGTHPHGLNPFAVRAMAEAGIDISRHASKRPEDIGTEIHVVVTVCDSAHEACPAIPGARVIHVGFDDPPRLAAAATTDDEAMPHYRRVRDEIRAFVEQLPEVLG